MRRLDLLTILLLALSSNADNVGVGVAYGIRGINVPLASNLLIALVTGAGTIASMLVGQTIGGTMQPKLASILGGIILAGIGGWVIVQSARSAGSDAENHLARRSSARRPASGTLRKLTLILDNPLTIDRDFSGHIDMKEGCLLAAALTLNNIVSGAAAGMLGLSVVLTTTAVMSFSMLTLWMGLVFGYHYGRRLLGSLAGFVSGLLLVTIGLYQIQI